MKRRSVVFRLGMLLTSLLIVGCSDPCRDYCERFMERTNECGLGGPQPVDSVVDSCGEEVSEKFSDSTCEDVTDEMDSMSCAEFKTLVCAQPNASSTYNCAGS